MTDIIHINNVNLQRKSERIAAAIFLVSNIISDTETIKTKLRTLSLEVVSLCISLNDNTNNNKLASIRTLEKRTLELISLLDIASVAGLISEMNGLVIKKEFELFLQSLTDLLKTFFISKENLTSEFFNNLNKSDKEIGDSIKDIISKDVSKQIPNNVFDSGIKDRLNRKDQRSKCILDLINKKGVVSIKDISASIKGCSEKTVQRELSHMIKGGIVKKMGERRWSKYSLVNTS